MLGGVCCGDSHAQGCVVHGNIWSDCHSERAVRQVPLSPVAHACSAAAAARSAW